MEKPSDYNNKNMYYEDLYALVLLVTWSAIQATELQCRYSHFLNSPSDKYTPSPFFALGSGGSSDPFSQLPFREQEEENFYW